MLEIIKDIIALNFDPASAGKAAAAIEAALKVGVYAPPGILFATAELLVMAEDAEKDPPSVIYKRAACALEWGAPEWQTFGHLPSAGWWNCYQLDRSSTSKNFVWRRVATGGTGNGGVWVPGTCRTGPARALFAWFRAQTTVPFYGGYWWELADLVGFRQMDEMADKVRRVRDAGGLWPHSCGMAGDIDPRLGRLTGPRMWAFVEAVAPGPWPEDKPEVTRRLEKAAERRAIAADAAAVGVKFV